MKILTIIGARPQFIKAATVSRAIRAHNDKLGETGSGDDIVEIICHTGQHFDANMSDVFFDQLDIPKPDHHLGISSLSHGAMTGRMCEAIETLIQKEAPDCLLVYGDTNSTLAGALAAAKLHVPVAHVEAGLRSHNLSMPEEINRVLTDRIASLLFCPTAHAVDNLNREGFPFSTPNGTSQRIENVGDVMYDAVLYYQALARAEFDLDSWGLEESGYALCTLHRQENTDNPQRLNNILVALREISRKFPVVLPLHPRTRNCLEQEDQLTTLDGLKTVDPMPYLEMQRLQMSAHVILTDSGGMQKEAYFHGVPCITLREETEWLETVEMGWNQVVGSDCDKILSALERAAVPRKVESAPYGNGNTGGQVISVLKEVFRGVN